MGVLDMTRWGAWGLDFCRAVSCRPWWARLLFWVVLGESGRHEFWGLVWSIDKDGMRPFEWECEWRGTISKMPLFWRGVHPVNPEWTINDRERDLMKVQ